MHAFIQALVDQFPSNSFLLDDAISSHYHSDWSHIKPSKPLAVLRPGSTQEAADMMQLANQHQQPIVIQGGLTGLSGGATPQEGEVSISLERMRGIESIDQSGMTMTVKAGTPLESVQQAADAAGFLFPLDLGARGSCHIGGNIATNAGGNQVIRYGSTRALVLGLEVVLADGRIISSMNHLLKNNAGFDLKHLFIGSEGTLGIITRAVLRLFPKPTTTATALCALNNFDDCVTLLKQCKQQFAESLSSFEIMWESYTREVFEQPTGIQNPLDEIHPFTALIEVRGNDPENDQETFENFLGQLFEQDILVDASIAANQQQAENFWAIRDGIGQLHAIYPTSATNFDIGIKIDDIEAFIQQSSAELEEQFPGITNCAFGHLGDGNIHLVVRTERVEDNPAIYAIVFKYCTTFNASISAEHGVGTLRRKYLPISRSDNEIALMHQLKASLDPNSILNNKRVI